MTALQEGRELRRKIQEGLNDTGVYVFNHRSLFPTAGERIVAQLQLAQQLGVLLTQLGQEQEAEEARTGEEEEREKHTREFIQQASRQLKNEFKTIFRDVRKLSELFENFAHFETIINKAQRDVEIKSKWLVSQARNANVTKSKDDIIRDLEKGLDAISADLKLEKRMERRENVVLLQRSLTIEREVDAFIPKFFQHVQDLHAFVETLERNSKQRNKLNEIALLLSEIVNEYKQLAGTEAAFKGHFERVGTFEKDQRQPLEQEIFNDITQMKHTMKGFTDAEFSARINTAIEILRKKILSTDEGVKSLANCDQGIIGAMRDSREDIQKMLTILNKIEEPLEKLERLLNPSIWERLGNNLLHRTGNVNPLSD